MAQTKRRPVITVSELDALKAKGMTQSEIARQLGVTRAYISWIKHTYGGKLTPREEAMKHWPWDVRQRHTSTTPYQRLRDYVEYRATGGEGLSKARLERLHSWLEAVEYVVVEYDEDNKPTPGISAGGFKYVERMPEDGERLIRLPESKEWTAEMETLFSRPQRIGGVSPGVV